MHARMDRRSEVRRPQARLPVAAALRTAGLLLLAGAGLLPLAGCGAPGKSGSTRGGDAAAAAPRALRVRWRIYSSGQDLALASQGAQDRTETYSKAVAIDAAGTKVAPDDVVAAMIEFLDENGPMFQPGAAPAADGAYSQSIEVDEAGARRFIAVGKSSPLEDQKRFQECWKGFAAVYNQTYQLQTVEEAPDWQRQNDVLKAQKARRTP